MLHEELVHIEEKDGFTIRFYACEEDSSPDGHFDSGDDEYDQEILDKIADGTYTWFIAKVTASKEGIELADEYLGGCCYDTPMQFVKDNDYYADMVNTVIAEAKNKIAKLTSTVKE